MRSSVAVSLALSAALTLAPAPLRAGGTTTAAIHGTVKDPAGNPVEGAEVQMTHQGFGTKLSLKSDAKGKFTQIGIKPGAWDVLIKKTGFSDRGETVQLKLGAHTPVDFVLQPAAAAGGASGNSFNLGAVKLSKEAAEAYDKAQQALAKGETDKAREALEKLIGLEPSLPGPYFVLAQIYRDAGDDKRAVELIREGFTHKPDKETEATAWIALGEIQSDTGQTDEAISAFRQARDASPDNPLALRKLAMALLVKQDFGAAAEALDAYLKAAPNAPDAEEKKALLEECNKLKVKK